MKQTFIRKMYPFGIILFIACLSVAARIYKIDSPIADWHSWRQADTAQVAQLYMRDGVDLLRPRYGDLSNIQSGKDNPNGWRMVEFPMYQASAVLLHRIFIFASVEMWLRYIAIFWSTIAGLGVGILVGRRYGWLAGICAQALYALLPYSVFYGRTILPDTPAVGLSVLSLVFIDIAFQRNGNKQLIMLLFSAITAAFALLTKPVSGFLFLPIAFRFVIEGIRDRKVLLYALVYASVALIPFLLWRKWITQFPEGIASYVWLFNKDNIRFKGAWFRWIFEQRIGALILGTWGIAPFIVGIGRRIKDTSLMLPLLLVGSIGYLVIFAGGNVQHDYYQILVLPIICAYTGIGLDHMITGLRNTKKTGIFWQGSILGLICVLFGFMFSWYTVRTYYWINHPEILEVGKVADTMLPMNAKVIAPYNGDTTFLYHIGRQGWPLGFDIDKKIAQGATHYVTLSPSDLDLETRDLAHKYKVLVRNEKFAILDLTREQESTGSSHNP